MWLEVLARASFLLPWGEVVILLSWVSVGRVRAVDSLFLLSFWLRSEARVLGLGTADAVAFGVPLVTTSLP